VRSMNKLAKKRRKQKEKQQPLKLAEKKMNHFIGNVKDLFS
jgi:hypothetical protein